MNRTKSWLQILRLPNLLTVPGDPIAGFFLCAASRNNWSSLAMAAGSALCLYAFGLLCNDYFDRHFDEAHRPERPIPRKLIHPSSALRAAITAAAAALLLALGAGPRVLVIAVAILVLSLIYNTGLKRIVLWGPMCMGACRGLSILLGAAAAMDSWLLPLEPIVAALTMTFYIAAVTHIAKSEVAMFPISSSRWFPMLALPVGFIGLFFAARNNVADPVCFMSYTVFAGIAIAVATISSVAIGTLAHPHAVRRSVSRLLQGIFPIQAAFISMGTPECWIIWVTLCLAWPLFRGLEKQFHVS